MMDIRAQRESLLIALLYFTRLQIIYARRVHTIGKESIRDIAKEPFK